MDTPEIDTSTVEPSVKVKPVSFGWLWPAITNEVEAKKAAKSGAHVAVLIAILNSAVSLVAIVTKEPFLGMDGWGLTDALLFAVIAWRIYKFSFPWAIVGLLLYLAEICWRWTTFSPPPGPGIIITSLIILALIAGVRGTAFLSKRENINGLLYFVVVIAFAAAFSMYVYRSTHAGLNGDEKKTLDASHATELENDFVSLNKDYEAKDWDGFRDELISREHYLVDLKTQDQYLQSRLSEEPAESDNCGRLGEHALQGFITAQDNLMSFAKDNIILTHDSAPALKSLLAQNDSASQQWNSYIDNFKNCVGSK
jgi:hypothetical protein